MTPKQIRSDLTIRILQEQFDNNQKIRPIIRTQINKIPDSKLTEYQTAYRANAEAIRLLMETKAADNAFNSDYAAVSYFFSILRNEIA